MRQNQKILSIGSGLGGLEIEILKKFASSKITFIEKNYTSDKIKYGWDYENKEGIMIYHVRKISSNEQYIKRPIHLN